MKLAAAAVLFSVFALWVAASHQARPHHETARPKIHAPPPPAGSWTEAPRPAAHAPRPPAVESGQLAYLREGRPFGSERWAIRREADGSSEVQVGVIFANARIRGAGSLKLGPKGEPRAYEFKVDRAKGAARITATFTDGKARCEVREESNGAERVVLSRDVAVPPAFAVVEEGVVSLDALALRGVDPARAGEQEIKVLVPQLGEVHSFLVQTRGSEDVMVGEKKERVSARHHVVRYRGSEQHYWIDPAGRLVRCTAESAAGAVEIALVPEAPQAK